jgi:hypothetical protein
VSPDQEAATPNAGARIDALLRSFAGEGEGAPTHRRSPTLH